MLICPVTKQNDFIAGYTSHKKRPPIHRHFAPLWPRAPKF